MKLIAQLKRLNNSRKVEFSIGFLNEIKLQTFAILGCGLFLLSPACITKENSGTLLTSVPSGHSNITFRNDIKEDENNNIDTYEYLYNGGGVAIGDLNQDGLQDILFTGNMTENKLYLNRGDLQFEDITAQSGFTGRDKWKTGAAIVDVNGDHLPDIYLCYSGPGTDEERSNELYINMGITDGVPHFKESAKAYGLDAPGTFTTMVNFFDMDNDGDLDMFMVNHADMFYNPFFNSDKLRKTRHPKFGNRLYKNENGFFTDISEQANIDGSGLNFGLNASVSDLNNDGWPDIYVTNDYDERDFMYLNQQDGSFREVLHTAARHISESSMGSDIADYNNDGTPDLIVLDMLPENNYRQKTLKGPDKYDKYMQSLNLGFHRQQMRNTLQLNNGNDKEGVPIFSEIGQLAGISNTDWSWAPLFADFDNDGWKDLFISNGILRDITNLDFVKYALVYSSKSKGQTQNKMKMWEQIREMPTPPLNNYIFRNNHDLSFTNVTQNWGVTKTTVSSGAAYADLDNDGDLDLIINTLNDQALVYRNNASGGNNAHFLKIRFVGEGHNTQGIGAKVFIKTNQGSQMQEQYLTRGFQSTIDPVMHIGLGADSIVSSLLIKWPGGKVSQFEQVKADTLLTVYQSHAAMQPPAPVLPVPAPVFTDITEISGIDFTHRPSGFVDFKPFPLLPFQLSKTGPCLGKADVNLDGLEDVFVGASSGQESGLYLQTAKGSFIRSASQPWNNHKEITNTDALFFDADGDGDADLYLVSGGAEYAPASKNYQDRIFENDGKGNFKQLENALPVETISGSCARAADLDKNGLPDLFVGGMFTPGRFPVAPESFILKNKSTAGKICFEKDSVTHDASIKEMGMVTDAVWTDINKDGWEDLIVVGQFMPVRIFGNHGGKLKDETNAYGLSGTNGWWRRILADDFDNDGDTDFVIGNLGLNSSFKATPREPLSITYGDFFSRGVIIPILCYYNGGKNYPWYSKDEMAEQIPYIQKKFQTYKDYAQAGITDIFTEEQLKNASTIEVKMLQSIYLQNEGNKKFTINTLPNFAQMSALNGLLSADIDADGNKDIILSGNFYPLRVQVGPLDASIGMVLKGDGKGGFQAQPYQQTGLFIDGDVRNMICIKDRKKLIIFAAKNNGKLQVLKCTAH